MLDILQFHHPVSQQFQGPALPPIGSLATRQMNQLGFSFAIQTATLRTFLGKLPARATPRFYWTNRCLMRITVRRLMPSTSAICPSV